MTTAGVAAVGETAEFQFSEENRAAAERIIARYPAGRQASAVMPLLDLAQRQSANWLPRAAIDAVARMVGIPPVRVLEVATFYTMYRHQPVGRHLVQVCTTTPCWLRGSDQIVSACERKLGIHMGETTADGQFTLGEVECAGACVNAPVVQIGDDYYEDLDPASIERILDALARGETPKPGSQTGRQTSCPQGGPTSLTAVPVRVVAAPEPEVVAPAPVSAPAPAEPAVAAAAAVVAEPVAEPEAVVPGPVATAPEPATNEPEPATNEPEAEAVGPVAAYPALVPGMAGGVVVPVAGRDDLPAKGKGKGKGKGKAGGQAAADDDADGNG